MSRDLIVDSRIRSWVFLPIVVITFLAGILRHYISVLIASQKSLYGVHPHDSQLIARARLLRENAKFIPKTAFLMRKRSFNRDGDGYLTHKISSMKPNIMTDHSVMANMLKGNLTNALPMILIGGWINWMFSGFITTQVPFPLTLRFKSMLQRDIELAHLDASWVSSASWYFFNVCGLRSISTLILGESGAADTSRLADDLIPDEILGMPGDLKTQFKSEWEALEILEHKWALQGVEKILNSKRNQVKFGP